jgi:hypothetical protein
MSRRLSIVSGKDVVEAPSKVGYGVVRQPGLLGRIISDASLLVEKFTIC